MKTFAEEVRAKRWKWLGYVLKMSKTPRYIVLTWAPEGKHRRGRPRETWRRNNQHGKRKTRIQDMERRRGGKKGRSCLEGTV